MRTVLAATIAEADGELANGPADVFVTVGEDTAEAITARGFEPVVDARSAAMLAIVAHVVTPGRRAGFLGSISGR